MTIVFHIQTQHRRIILDQRLLRSIIPSDNNLLYPISMLSMSTAGEHGHSRAPQTCSLVEMHARLGTLSKLPIATVTVADEVFWHYPLTSLLIGLLAPLHHSTRSWSCPICSGRRKRRQAHRSWWTSMEGNSKELVGEGEQIYDGCLA